MIRRLFLFMLILFAFYFGAYYALVFINQKLMSNLNIPVFYVFLYFFVSSFIVFVCVEYFKRIIFNQIGVLFLSLIFVKIGFFVLVFKSNIFGNFELNKIDKISLFIGLIISTVSDVIFVSKSLKR